MTKRAFVLLALASACTDDWGVGVGVIEFNSDRIRIEVTPSVVGVPFTVTVMTYGSGSCVSPESTDVEVEGDLATITPYDRRRERGPCTADLRFYPHAVDITFDTPGTKLLRVIGRRVGFRSDYLIWHEQRVYVD